MDLTVGHRSPHFCYIRAPISVWVRVDVERLCEGRGGGELVEGFRIGASGISIFKALRGRVCVSKQLHAAKKQSSVSCFFIGRSVAPRTLLLCMYRQISQVGVPWCLLHTVCGRGNECFLPALPKTTSHPIVKSQEHK